MRCVCKYAGVGRTQLYKKLRGECVRRAGRPPPGFTINRDGERIEDAAIVTKLRWYRAQPEFLNGGGSRKLTHYLAQEHRLYVNHKKIYRLCRDNDVLLFRGVKQGKRMKKQRCEYSEITRPNQLWQFDLKYVYVHGEGRWCFILAFIDVFSKKAINTFIGLSVKAGDLMLALNQALMKESIEPGHGLRIRSDNGPQMSSNRFHFYLKRLEQKLSHEFIPPRTPNRNAYVEAFFSILENEWLLPRYFHRYADAYRALVDFVEFYNTRRIHGSIGNRSPKRFLEDLENGLVPPMKISA